MFSNELARRLINMPKEIDGAHSTISLADEKSRLILSNAEEPEYEFLFEITLNKKISFKVSLHSQENNVKEGLLRVDYKGGHKNPETISGFVPDLVRPYVGYFFMNEPHIHLYVEGYKDLAWAVPLTTYGFPVVDINDNDELSKSIKAFAKEINIRTPLQIQHAII